MVFCDTLVKAKKTKRVVFFQRLKIANEENKRKFAFWNKNYLPIPSLYFEIKGEKSIEKLISIGNRKWTVFEKPEPLEEKYQDKTNAKRTLPTNS